MKFFYDTEFLEDGKHIHLISFAMVTEDLEHEFYAVNADAPWDAILHNDWLRANVMDSIEHGVNLNPFQVNVTDKAAMPYQMIGLELFNFVEKLVPEGDRAEFWAYYSDYDHVALAQLYGTMLQMPQKFPIFTMDIKQLAVMKGDPVLPKMARNGWFKSDEHNALADARHNVTMYKFLTENGHSITEEYL